MTRQKMVSKVLEVKELTREQIEGEVRKARTRLAVEQEKMDSLERSYKETSIELTDRQLAGSLPISEMDVYYAYLKQTGNQIRKQKEVLAVCQRDVDALQTAMVEAYKEHRLVELLHGKIVSQDAKLAGQAEQKDSDSAYIMRKAER